MGEQMDQDSRQIKEKIRDISENSIIQAIQEVTIESDKFVSIIKDEAKKILKETREQASIEARQESERIINETREKTARIVREATERAKIQIKDEFNRVTLETRNKLENETSTLFTVIKNIQRIVSETETAIQSGIENITVIISETEKQLQTINEISGSEEPAQVDPPEKQEPGQPTGEAVPPVMEEPLKVEVSEDITLDTKILLHEGMALLKMGKNEEALQVFSRVVELTPNSAVAWRNMGNIFNTLGRYEEAVQAFTKVTELDPQDIAASNSRAIALTNYKNKKKTEEAKGIGDQTKQESQDVTFDARMQMQEGEHLLQSGKNKEALDIFTKVLMLDPGNAVAWRKKGTTLGLLGRHEEALKADEKAIELNPKDIVAWHNKVAALTHLGNKEKAKEAQEIEKRLKKEA